MKSTMMPSRGFGKRWLLICAVPLAAITLFFLWLQYQNYAWKNGGYQTALAAYEKRTVEKGDTHDAVRDRLYREAVAMGAKACDTETDDWFSVRVCDMSTVEKHPDFELLNPPLNSLPSRPMSSDQEVHDDIILFFVGAWAIAFFPYLLVPPAILIRWFGSLLRWLWRGKS